MALNTFVVKKWGALILSGFLPSIFFFIGLTFYSFLIALILLMVGVLLSVFVASKLLSNPFTLMVEGKGLLTMNIDSTGVIRPFIVGLNQPYVIGKLQREMVNDVYDREAVLSMAAPIKAGQAVTSDKLNNESEEDKKDPGLYLRLTNDDFNKSRFGMYHYPVLIYNNQVKSMLTKEFLSGQEKQAFAEHGVLYLNRKMEELTGHIRDFGRHIVELTKPKESIFKNKVFLVILIGFVVLMMLLFGKPLLNSIMATGGAAVSAVGGSKAAVIPR